MKNLNFEANEMLFGQSDEKNIVGVEVDKSGKVIIYKRINNKIEKSEDKLTPFMLVKSEKFIRHLETPVTTKELNGNLFYKYLLIFENIKDYSKAKDQFKKMKLYGEYFIINDYVHQYLLLTGKVHFKSMEFKDIKRMALDIETRTEPGYNFPNPEREGDRIISIALATNQGKNYILSLNEYSEKELLEKMVEIIKIEDPDVIEGHNIFKFDLSYIKKRAELNKVKLKLGRDGSTIKSRNSRFNIAERVIDYPKFEIHGRTIIDTWILVQSYDVSGRDLPSYGLKEVASYFGVTEKNREIVDCSNIDELFKENPELVLKYNLQDSLEVISVSDILTRGYFYQAKIFPYSFQNVIIRGNATKINSLMIREYLNRNHSISGINLEVKRSFAGGYTDIFNVGIFRDILHCDVQSLYPSIMMSFGIKPESDELGIFLEFLTTLKNFRIDAKNLMKQEKDPHLKLELNTLQTTFKILINSFYGYLGTVRHNFSDLEAASLVTEKGRSILEQMVNWLENNNCKIIELDTDGIYFVGNEKIDNPEEFIKFLSDTLPEGIEVEYDGSYEAMFSYKKKNYALKTHDNTLTIKGSGLKSRGLEKFQREFLNKLILFLMDDKCEKIEELFEKNIENIENRKINIEKLTKTEVLVDSIENYKKKISAGRRNRSAVYELALKSDREFRPGDRITYYITGNKKSVRAFEAAKLLSDYDPNNPDYNIPYYVDKLKKLYKKFEDFITIDSEQGMLF